MNNLDKVKAKENFLKNVTGVSREEVLDVICKNAENLDLYTYFVTLGACNEGWINETELQEFLHKLYSDWYYLHKNNPTSLLAVKLLGNTLYSPLCLNYQECMDLLKDGRFNEVLPISLQYINKLEGKYYISIKVDEIYGKKFDGVENNVRLYLNLPASKILEFTKEFFDRVYLSDIPMTYKFLNSDNRCDTVIIYCDYLYASKIVEIIEEIKKDFPNKLKGIGDVNVLLGNISGFIGFGEQPKGKTTYFKSRTQVLTEIGKQASNQVLKSNIVEPEKKVIFKSDGKSYTPTEFMLYLIENSATKLIENKINELEYGDDSDLEELQKLYRLRENLNDGIDFNKNINMLKRSLTRDEEYHLELDGVGVDDYNYVNKLYNVFSDQNNVVLKDKKKKELISKKIFKVTESFEGVNTRDYLETYFKQVLQRILEELIDEQMEEVKYAKQSSILTELKRKQIVRLKSIIKSIIDGDDEGKEYLSRCIEDYVRILSTNAMENVEIFIGDNRIKFTDDVSGDIIQCLPVLYDNAIKMSYSSDFIDSILCANDINSKNLCINYMTKNLCKVKTKEVADEDHFYYNPEGVLSK